MSFLKTLLFGPSKEQPPPHPTDHVITLSALDSSWMMRMMVMGWSMRFNDVLDADKLRQLLEELITNGPGWQKLGGRLRLTPDKRLQLHVPETFTQDRPALFFSQAAHNISIKEHELNDAEPNPSASHPCILEFDRFRDVLIGPSAPRSFDDYRYSDRPALTLHVILFTDATIVTLTYPHCLTDGMGRKDLISNWCKILAGRSSEITPLFSPSDAWTSDPMALAASSPAHTSQPFFWAAKKLRGWGKWSFVFRLLFYLLTNPRRQQRNLFIPAAAMGRLRAEANRDSNGEKSVGDGMLLTTWLTRLAAFDAPPNRPVAVNAALDLRGRLAAAHMDPQFAYVQNLVAYNWVNLSGAEFLGGSLGHAARLVRAQVLGQVTEAQIYASAKATWEAVAKNGSTDVFADPDAFVMSVSNVSRAKFHEVIDFGPAVVRPGGDGENWTGTPSGRPVWQINSPRYGIMPTALAYVQGFDHGGNVWVQMVLSERVWRRVEEEVSRV